MRVRENPFIDDRAEPLLTPMIGDDVLTDAPFLEFDVNDGFRSEEDEWTWTAGERVGGETASDEVDAIRGRRVRSRMRALGKFVELELNLDAGIL